MFQVCELILLFIDLIYRNVMNGMNLSLIERLHNNTIPPSFLLETLLCRTS